MKDEEHIGIDTVTILMPKKAQRFVRIIVRLLIAPFLYVLVAGSFPNIGATWNNYLPTVPWFRMGVIYLIVLISGIIMSYYLIFNLILDIRGVYKLKTRIDELTHHDSAGEENAE